MTLLIAAQRVLARAWQQWGKAVIVKKTAAGDFMPRSVTTKTKKKSAPDTARLRLQLRVLLAEEIALGPGKAELLQAIQTTGSISAAGRAMDMSYRRAWLLVDAMNRCFVEPLVDTAKGGSQGGGARLTLLGEQVLGIYRQMQDEARAVAEPHFLQLAMLLRDEPLPPPG